MSPRSSDRHGRTPEEIKRHYDVEKELASLLCSAGREERPGLYGRLYAELFRKVPDHPSLKVDTALAINSLRGQMLFLRRFLNSDATLMEIGSGTCMLSLEAAKHVKKVYAIDVEDQTSKSARKPDNFQLIIYEGIDIPLPEGSVNIAYSNQMIEHLHPDDALALTQDIYRVLAPGGIYVCSTPNRLSGPWDVSRSFDSVATCFHLKEYTLTELSNLLREAGFAKVSAYPGLRSHYMRFPLSVVSVCEAALRLLPHRLRRPLAGGLPFRALLDAKLAEKK